MKEFKAIRRREVGVGNTSDNAKIETGEEPEKAHITFGEVILVSDESKDFFEV
jgi:hypothetical protein